MVGDQDDWGAWAVCRSADPEELFAEGAAQNRAKVLCTGCPVRTECLAHALDHRIEHGVWGGMTERERRALLKRRPTVTSWRRLLESARAEHGRYDTANREPGRLRCLKAVQRGPRTRGNVKLPASAIVVPSCPFPSC
ncbi:MULTISPECIES: WhiB family transcriptional regulator [Streptomyces]|uniref:Transcriptional regulator WhiB n=1 Tax=Streptomyces galilaeus TaxID=33899 RepID=A0ABW9J0X7_STRGJ